MNQVEYRDRRVIIVIRARVIHHLHIVQQVASVESAVRRLRSGWILKGLAELLLNSERTLERVRERNIGYATLFFTVLYGLVHNLE